MVWRLDSIPRFYFAWAFRKARASPLLPHNRSGRRCALQFVRMRWKTIYSWAETLNEHLVPFLRPRWRPLLDPGTAVVSSWTAPNQATERCEINTGRACSIRAEQSCSTRDNAITVWDRFTQLFIVSSHKILVACPTASCRWLFAILGISNLHLRCLTWWPTIW